MEVEVEAEAEVQVQARVEAEECLRCQYGTRGGGASLPSRLLCESFERALWGL